MYGSDYYGSLYWVLTTHGTSSPFFIHRASSQIRSHQRHYGHYLRFDHEFIGTLDDSVPRSHQLITYSESKISPNMVRPLPQIMLSLSGSGLARKQRSLVVIVIILLCYIALGGFVNSLLHLSFTKGLCFTLVSIETIGFGDIAPETTGVNIWVCMLVWGLRPGISVYVTAIQSGCQRRVSGMGFIDLNRKAIFYRFASRDL